MKITLTAFKKLSIAKAQSMLPLEVNSNNKVIYNVTKDGGVDNAKLLKLLLGNDTDAVHVADAQRRIDAVFGTTPITAPSTKPATPLNAKISGIVSKPYWLGNWSGDIKNAVQGIVNENKSVTSLLVAYNIPARDLGSYSAGGLDNSSEYAKWIQGLADGIGTSKAIVILEPDALGHSRDMPNDAQQSRYNMLKNAVVTLKKNANTLVYIDSSTWAGVDDSVRLIKLIPGGDGFSCNVSGYEAQSDVTKYADEVAKRTGLKYVCDTSRNGNGSPHPGKWCNMTDTKIGTTNTLNPTQYCDAYLWIKVPGESDGKGINDDGTRARDDVPSAGTFWVEYRDAIYSGDWTAFKAKYKV